MDFKTILFEEKDGIARIFLFRPDDQNAINVVMVDELLKIFHHIEDESDSKVVVISGKGDNFCSGIDLRDFPEDSPPDVYGFSRWEKTIRALERLPKPTIAAIDGKAAGGGFQLALACDTRVATERSILQTHEVNMGFLPGMATFRLAKFIGLGRARRMALTGREVLANEGLQIGLLDMVCPADLLTETVKKACGEFADADPTSIELTRRLLDESFEMAYEDFIGGFLAAQHRAARSKTFLDRVKKAHAKNTPQGQGE